MENQEKKHKRRVRYSGAYPKNYREKYKELQPEKYADTISKAVSYTHLFGIAAVHSGVIMGGMYRHIQYLSAGDVARNILLAAGLAVILYSVYFITTYSGSKRILKL